MVDVIGGKIRPVKEALCGLIHWSSPPTRGPVFPRGDTACQRHFRQVNVFKRDRLGQDTRGRIFTSDVKHIVREGKLPNTHQLRHIKNHTVPSKFRNLEGILPQLRSRSCPADLTGGRCSKR